MGGTAPCVRKIDGERRAGDGRFGLAVDAAGLERFQIVDIVRQADGLVAFRLGSDRRGSDRAGGFIAGAGPERRHAA